MTKYKPYTDEQIQYLREITPGRSYKEVHEMYNKKFGENRTFKAIGATLKRNGIKNGLSGEFTKGQEPWNKGTKGLMKPNKTSFKKGNSPENYRPVGATRYCAKDGYKLIKIADPDKWELAHRVIWEQHNGKIPKGHTVIFKDRDITNLDIDNLALISRAELS